MMAMNKKEKDQLETACRLMEINRALRWSDYTADFDVGAPEANSEYANGWSVNVHAMRVYKSWSSAISHGDGWSANGERPRSASQRGIAQYSSEEKALKALRHELEMKFAASLHDIDAQISKYSADQQ